MNNIKLPYALNKCKVCYLRACCRSAQNSWICW